MKNKFYISKNATFLIISNEKTQTLKKIIESNYKQVKGKASFRNEQFTTPRKLKIEKRNTKQLTVAFNYRTTSIKESQDVITLDFISNYLANKWISRLIEELRFKKDITYWVDGESVNFYDTGCIGFIFSCNKANVNQAINIILKEIEKLKSLDISDEILNTHKKSFLSSLARQFVNPFELMWWYGYQGVLKDKILTLSEYMNKISTIDQAQIHKVSKKYLIKNNLSISVIGQIEEKKIKIPN